MRPAFALSCLVLSGCFVAGYERHGSIDDVSDAAGDAGKVPPKDSGTSPGDAMIDGGYNDVDSGLDLDGSVVPDGSEPWDGGFGDACTDGGCNQAIFTCEGSSCSGTCPEQERLDPTRYCFFGCGDSQSCTTSCAENAWCDTLCGSAGNCRMTCPTGALCRLGCTEGDSCRTECQAGARCWVRCDLGADCLLRCSRDAFCSFTNCPDAVRCSDTITVCGRPCP